MSTNDHKRIGERLMRHWYDFPSQRLGQFLYNAIAEEGDSQEAFHQKLFYLSDDELLNKCRVYRNENWTKAAQQAAQEKRDNETESSRLAARTRDARKPVAAPPPEPVPVEPDEDTET